MRLRLGVLLAAACIAGPAGAADDKACLRAACEELAETDTSLSTGNCAVATEEIVHRLRAIHYSAEEVRLIVPPEFSPQENAVVQLAGSDPSGAPALFLAHADIVEAKRPTASTNESASVR